MSDIPGHARMLPHNTGEPQEAFVSNGDSQGKPSRATTIVDRLQNSKYVAPLIVFGVVVAGLANFTDALSKLGHFLLDWRTGQGIAVSGRGPLYENPRASGRTIDGCLLTMKSQVGNDPDICNGPAQMEIASQFCEAAGYERALNFTTSLVTKYQKSYKLSQVLATSGEVKHVWNKDDRGGYIFTSILCEREK